MRSRHHHLVPGSGTGGMRLPQALLDGSCLLQDHLGLPRDPGDPWDGRQSMVHKDLGDLPHQCCQAAPRA
jgi:hypothetical protein